MTTLLNVTMYLFQLVYWGLLLVLCKWLYDGTVKSEHASANGKIISATGAVLTAVGVDSCFSAFFVFVPESLFGISADVLNGVHSVQGLTHIPVVFAGWMIFVGSALVWVGVLSKRWRKPQAEGLEQH